MKVDPIIAVKNVEGSAKWYQKVFGLRGVHGGNEFEILVDEADEVALCLHAWDQHNHPTMLSSNMTAGNGLILYFRSADIEGVRQKLSDMNWEVEQEIALNPNSRRNECSFRDPDGYYITVSEFHEYQG